MSTPQTVQYELVLNTTFKSKSGALFYDLVPVRPFPTRSPARKRKLEELVQDTRKE